MRRDLPGIPSFLDGGRSIPDFETAPGPLFFLSLLLVQGGGMDLARVGEKLLSSVRSARNLGITPADRPENFDPVRYVMEGIPSEENDVSYFEKQATRRLSQLDWTAEGLSRHVMEHHKEMVRGMQLVMEVEQDLKAANVICKNGRRHIASSMSEVSRDLVVHSNSKKKKVLLGMLPILTELRHALDMQKALDTLVEDGNYFRNIYKFWLAIQNSRLFKKWAVVLRLGLEGHYKS